jgi:calcium-dependent protein kinase
MEFILGHVFLFLCDFLKLVVAVYSQYQIIIPFLSILTAVQQVNASAAARNNKNPAPTLGTDPADDESVKSFGSQRSASGLKSTTDNSSGAPKSNTGYSSGNEFDSGGQSLGDASSVGSIGADSSKRQKSLKPSSSIIGLDSMIENRREEGSLMSNVVHMEVPFGKPIEEVYDGVHTGPVLGSGISGLVRLVTHKATGVKYAVKCLDLGLVDTDEGLARLREEIFIMCQLDHPNIVRLEEVYESHSEIYLVQELCLGGELFDRLDEQPDYHYTEAECARLVKQMLCAVRYLHSKGIIHRDLKLENFLFSSTATDSELKMIDFGLSKHFRYGEVQHEAVGTPYTVAPEVISGSYDERCDIWAIGVIAFLLLSGEPPFGGCGGPEPLMTVRANILAGSYAFEPADVWDLVSQGARTFIKSLLVTDPQYRPTARSAQKLPWLTEWADRARSEGDNVLNPNVVKALVNFKEFSDMRKLLCEVLSFTLLPEQIKDLRKEFEKMDTDGSGEISLSALKEVLVTNAGAGSLGALTEEEVEDIFNAMRVKKTETRIHWHEFIAAGLSQCKVDDRNLRLAFDRLDNDHKGYVTLDDIMDLLGNDALHSEDIMREMFRDSMKAVNCSQARITYEDFLLLMKGQTREAVDIEPAEVTAMKSLEAMSMSGSQLRVVLEEKAEEIADASPPLGKTSELQINAGDTSDELVRLTPLIPKPAAILDLEDTPLSMDDDDDIAEQSGSFLAPAMSMTPPTTPSRRQKEVMSPLHARVEAQLPLSRSDPDLQKATEASVPAMPKPRPYLRTRSRSYEENNRSQNDGIEESAAQMFAPDVRRALLLPEQDPGQLEGMLADEGKTALQHNRQLYRAHRQMRHSVMDASKRFEEQQARHARGVLLAQQAESDSLNKGQAGLVMRRVQNKTISTEQVIMLLEQNQKEQQSLMEVANRRGGRGRRNRKKTISDIGGMFGSMAQDEMTKISIAAAAPSEEIAPDVPKVIETTVTEPVETTLRSATVPGEFRKVSDPFGAHGKYGHFS